MLIFICYLLSKEIRTVNYFCVVPIGTIPVRNHFAVSRVKTYREIFKYSVQNTHVRPQKEDNTHTTTTRVWRTMYKMFQTE